MTEIPFSIDDKMCTRFATEIVLRRTSPEAPTTIKIGIIPAADESTDRKEALSVWSPEGFDGSIGLDKSTMESVFLQVCELMLHLTAANEMASRQN